MLDFEADELRDLVFLSKLFYQVEVGLVSDVVFEGRQNKVEKPIWVQLKVADKLLYVFLDDTHISPVNILLVQLY